jgi:hypothetical protein
MQSKTVERLLVLEVTKSYNRYVRPVEGWNFSVQRCSRAEIRYNRYVRLVEGWNIMIVVFVRMSLSALQSICPPGRRWNEIKTITRGKRRAVDLATLSPRTPRPQNPETFSAS